MNYHRSLKRQIRKVIGSDSELLQHPSINEFLNAVNDNYVQHDHDRRLLDRSLQLTSQELNERYKEIELRFEQAAERNRELEQLLSIIDSAVEASIDGIILVDENGIPRVYNQRAADLLCTSKEFIQHGSPEDFVTLITDVSYNPKMFIKQLEQVRRNKEAKTYFTLEMKNGLFVDIRSQPRIYNDKITGRVWSLHDITQLRKNEEVIRHRAYHDALTDLPNRTLFQDRIEHALKLNQVSNDQLALLFIDLDGFKHVNDSLGHEIGDKILIQVAERLNRAIGKLGTLARHGGDEFLLMLEHIKCVEQVIDVAKSILHIVSDAFHVDGQEIYISASVGITVAPKDGTAPDELIRKADMAMYYAKAQGRNNYQFFKESIADHSSRLLSLKSQLNQALQKQEFVLFFQPKIDLKTGRVCGAESLIRWQKEDGSIVPPGVFIEVAENSGLIIPISEWVFETACKQLAQWLPYLDDDFVLSVNLSAEHFKKRQLVDFIVMTLIKHKIPFNRFELELTESVVMDNPDDSIAKLKTLRDMGVNLSIDDFGTGYSSFNYLKDLPINIIKIDRSFILNIENSERDLSLVEYIVHIAHLLDLQVVVEGVETQKSANLLSGINCDIAQGYYYDKPLPEAEFKRYLKK